MCAYVCVVMLVVAVMAMVVMANVRWQLSEIKLLKLTVTQNWE